MKPFLRAAPGQPEAGHDFIKNQERAIVLGDFAEEFQKARAGQVQPRIAGDGFDDDAGNLAGVRREGGLHRRDIIVRHHDGVLRERGGNARAVRMTEGQRPGTGTHKQGIHVPMIAAVEFDNLVALGKAAGQADDAHAGLGAAAGHAHLFHAGHQVANQFGHGDFERIGHAKAGARFGGGLHGGDDFGMRMAEDGRSPGEHIINEFVAIHVPQFATGRAVHKKRLAAHGAKRAHGGIDAAGNIFQGFGKELFRLGARNHGVNLTNGRAGKKENEAGRTAMIQPGWPTPGRRMPHLVLDVAVEKDSVVCTLNETTGNQDLSRHEPPGGDI